MRLEFGFRGTERRTGGGRGPYKGPPPAQAVASGEGGWDRRRGDDAELERRGCTVVGVGRLGWRRRLSRLDLEIYEIAIDILLSTETFAYTLNIVISHKCNTCVKYEV